MSKIKIGLPSKGRLKDESLAFLKSKKLEVCVETKKSYKVFIKSLILVLLI